MPDAGDLAALLARRPILVVIAGPNGAGKTTFHHTHLAAAGLRFVNADDLGHDLDLDPRAAAAAADALRAGLIAMGESYVTETVFSDPVGSKLALFREAQAKGYTVVLCFIALGSAERSDERVAMRVSQGGHDVPREKVVARFPRILANLRAAIPVLDHVRIYDHDDLRRPYRLLASFTGGKPDFARDDPPGWWRRFAEDP